MNAHDPRRNELLDWLHQDLGRRVERLDPASEDASFRRYFRVTDRHGTSIAMDAPPAHEDVRPYLAVSTLLATTGVHVPEVLASDPVRGFLLLEDLGSVHYLARLRGGADADPDALYSAALDALATFQSRAGDAARALPHYDAAALRRELDLMPQWFAARHLGLEIGEGDSAVLGHAFDFLVGEALAQPRVFVHRDYHSRNLMVTGTRSPGIIDFQDAVFGPVAYDAVSLLKDCYIAWPRERVVGWVCALRSRLRDVGVPAGASEGEFLHWFDVMGLQRHLKVLGIFARLHHRDGKSGYLADLPLTLAYVREAAQRFEPLREFSAWLDARIAPAFARRATSMQAST